MAMGPLFCLVGDSLRCCEGCGRYLSKMLKMPKIDAGTVGLCDRKGRGFLVGDSVGRGCQSYVFVTLHPYVGVWRVDARPGSHVYLVKYAPCPP